jgi:myo-inositol 2-dehydrogenase / D-chiro-inositol 1-dehydrogenase
MTTHGDQAAGGRPRVLRAGVIGTGIMGADHVRRLARGVSGAAVVAVSDADRDRAVQVARDVGGCRVHDDPVALVKDPDVDVVVVASPDPTHEQFVVACLQEGKPVLCEKPLAETSAACLRVVEAEAAAGRRLVQVGFMRRYDPDYRALKQALDEGQVGDPLLVHCIHRNAEPPPYFGSEGALTESVVHEVDAVRWLLGHEIAAVTVLAPRATGHAPPEVQDPLLVLLETDGGVLVDVESFVRARYGYDVRCEVVGESGALELPRRVSAGYQEHFAQAYRDELSEWVDGRRSGATAWDGYAAAAVTEACVRSLAAGGRVEVKL